MTVTPTDRAGSGPATGPTAALASVASMAPILRTVYRLLLHRVATRGRLLAVGALSVASLASAVAVTLSAPLDSLGTATAFADGALSTLLPVAVLVFGAGTLGDLLDDGSLVYLWLRPVPSWVHVLAAWAATVTIAVPLVGVPTVVATSTIDPDPALLVGTMIAATLAIACYAALFVTVGIVVRRALPWGLAYILIWEGFVASAGETAARLAVRSYLRSILTQQTGVFLDLAEFNLASGVIVPPVVTVVALAVASRRLARADVA
ncbi:hypothetical protein BH23ACT2_BH23ACT2_19930 [soil metagenome]